MSSGHKMEDIYASLPRSLKSELRVRTKVEEDEEELKRRQNLVQSKSPAQLSQVKLTEYLYTTTLQSMMNAKLSQQRI